MVLRSFADKDTEKVWLRKPVKRWNNELCRAARRKMIHLEAASDLNELRVPPGNRLERLRGVRSGQYSIRVNRQWRLCFRWTEHGATDIELVDYH